MINHTLAILYKNERFSRIFPKREDILKDAAEYYGPYIPVVETVRTLLDLIKSVYPLRTCSY